MAYFSYEKVWRSEYNNNVSAKDRVQDKNLEQLKLKVNDSFKKDEKITINFRAISDEDIICKKNLYTKLSVVKGHLLYLKKIYTYYRYHEICNGEFLIEKTVITTIQTLYDKGLLDNYTYGNAHEV